MQQTCQGLVEGETNHFVSFSSCQCVAQWYQHMTHCRRCLFAHLAAPQRLKSARVQTDAVSRRFSISEPAILPGERFDESAPELFLMAQQLCFGHVPYTWWLAKNKNWNCWTIRDQRFPHIMYIVNVWQPEERPNTPEWCKTQVSGIYPNSHLMWIGANDPEDEPDATYRVIEAKCTSWSISAPWNQSQVPINLNHNMEIPVLDVYDCCCVRVQPRKDTQYSNFYHDWSAIHNSNDGQNSNLKSQSKPIFKVASPLLPLFLCYWVRGFKSLSEIESKSIKLKQLLFPWAYVPLDGNRCTAARSPEKLLSPKPTAIHCIPTWNTRPSTIPSEVCCL